MKSDLKIDPENIWADIQLMKSLCPLIHNITNYVAMEHTANSLLAMGVSPVMAHAMEEVEEMSKLSSSLVINIGTLSSSWIKGMQIALRSAKLRSLPVVLDPAGAGATNYRTDTVHTLLAQGGVKVIRGNSSEIASLDRGNKNPTKGVDSNITSLESLEQAKAIASNHRCVVWISGDKNLITDGTSVLMLENKRPKCGKITGMGSVSSAIVGAFLAVNPNALMASAHAAAVMGTATNLAAEAASGPGSFKVAFYDTLFNLSKKDLVTWVKKGVK